MRIGVKVPETEIIGRRQTGPAAKGRMFGDRYAEVMAVSGNAWVRQDNRLSESFDDRKDGKENIEESDTSEDRVEAVKVYKAVAAGKNVLDSLRQAAKVPYGHLAKDGVINYNGVCFVCDERRNSICLGDVTDESKVLTVGLSGGGCLKVNRDNLGDLAKAIGMFSPEDVNRIMRAIALDTKIQSMQKELEDMEASVGNQLDASRQESGEEEA